MANPQRIGWLPGRFDPVHAGHIALAQAALRTGRLDEVWFLVNHRPAHKPAVASARHRRAMVELALKGLAGLRADGLPWSLRGEPQTMQGFRRMARVLGLRQLQFVMGLDGLAYLPTWDEVESVVKSTSYWAVERPGKAPQTLAALREDLGPLGSRLAVQMLPVVGGGEVALSSSTAIRYQLREGQRPSGLDGRVEEYIRRYHLYT